MPPLQQPHLINPDSRYSGRRHPALILSIVGIQGDFAMATRLNAVGLFVAAALVTPLAIGVPLAAESQSISTDPDANATVKAPLEMIHVLFHNPVDMRTARMSVTDKSGKPDDV